ncbi:hypothetical protein [Amycolatopsis ultiminotia]|uniref:hypothetical protein n=1 Tax=Amycolatopsis ultiminotia TaxID=543629 RepID=UPI0031EC8EE8
MLVGPVDFPTAGCLCAKPVRWTKPSGRHDRKTFGHPNLDAEGAVQHHYSQQAMGAKTVVPAIQEAMPENRCRR